MRNKGTGPRVRQPPARRGEKDEGADKRVESFRVPCLDAGSTPATSTRTNASDAPGRFLFVLLLGLLRRFGGVPNAHFNLPLFIFNLPLSAAEPAGRSHPGRRPATLKSRGFRWLRPRTNKIPAHSRAPAPPGNPKTRKKAAPRRRDAASDRDQRGPLYRFCRSELSATTMFLSIRSVTSPSTSISSVVSLTSFTTP